MALKTILKNLFNNQDFKEELFIYDSVYRITGYNNLVSVVLNGNAGIIDLSSQKEVIPCKLNCKDFGQHRYLSNIYMFGNNWIATSYYTEGDWKEISFLRNKSVYYLFDQTNNIIVRQDKKYVIQDKSGNLISKIYFDEFKPIKRYAILVQANGKWGLLDQLQGIEIIPCKYDDYKLISDSIISVKSGDKWGIVDLEEIKETVPCKFEEIMCFTGDMIPVKAGGKWGFINKQSWNIEIPCTYNNIEPFNGEYAAVEQRKKWGIINKKNEKVLLSIYRNAIPIPGGLIIVWGWSLRRFRIINKDNTTIYEGFKDYSPEINEIGYITVCKPYNYDIQGLLCIKTGKLVVPCVYDQCFYNKGDRYAYISSGGKKGLYDIELERIAVPCKYDYASSAFQGVSLFRVDAKGKSGIFDEGTGIEQIPFKYSSVRGYYNYKIRKIEGGVLAVELDRKFGLVERSTWYELLPCVFEDYRFISSNVIAFKKNGKWGFFNNKGEQIVTCHSIKQEKPRSEGMEQSDTSQQKDVEKKKIKSKANGGDNEAKKKNGEKAIRKRNSKNDKLSTPTLDVEKLISAAVVDGMLTDKERSVILKKAKTEGYDADEFEIMLDAKLYESKQKGKKKVVKKAVTEKKVEKSNETSKQKKSSKSNTLVKVKAESKKAELKPKQVKQKKAATVTTRQKKK